MNAPNSEQLREAEAAALLARSRYGIGEPLTTPEPLAPETPQRNYKPLIGAATVLALASLGFGVWKGRQPATSATQTAPAVSSPAPQSPAATPAPVTTPTSLPSKATTTGAGSSKAESPKTVSTREVPAKPVPSRPADRMQQAIASPQVENGVSVRWILRGDLNRQIAAAEIRPASLPGSAEPPRLPMVVVIPNAPSVGDPTTPARPAVPISEGVTGGELVSKVAPIYPQSARTLGKKGAVIIAATINREGVLANLRALEGDPVLVDAALTAARKWKYQPYRLNGTPIEIETKIVFQFRP